VGVLRLTLLAPKIADAILDGRREGLRLEDLRLEDLLEVFRWSGEPGNSCS